jgi:mitochondrial fission protein ELM1
VQILDPRIDTREYDIVVAPAHDLLRGDNVINSIGAIHGIDAQWLIRARHEFSEFAALPRPLFGVLVGGPHREAPLTVSALLELLQRVCQQARALGGSVSVCGSRRTPAAWHPTLRAQALKHGARIWMHADDGVNPYRACLAYADRLVVTADSVNMLSEACALGVPVTSFSSSGLSGKLARFDDALRRAHLLSTLEHPVAPPMPLRETAGIAERILARWGESTGR